jgi:hypothetical protein
MTRLRVFLSRLLGVTSGPKLDADLWTEIDAHIAEAPEEFACQGVPADEARRLGFARPPAHQHARDGSGELCRHPHWC